MKDKTKKKSVHKNKRTKYYKLDNTANLFPVIVSESVSNVYRIAVELKEEIDGRALQEALDKVLPYFDAFKVRLKKGIFWYYFEENFKSAPNVHMEDEAVCSYINPYTNNDYMFRVTYFKKRINLEVFHVLTDGNGALTFLKELTYRYLRNIHPEISDEVGNGLWMDTSLDLEDSYVKNYKRSSKKGYKTEKAVIIKGEKLGADFGIIHGYLHLPDVKRVAKGYNVTINQYLLSVLTWAIYKEYLNGMPSENPICACVPVNLRPYFDSDTMKNFFTVVSSVFKPTKETYTFEEVLHEVSEGLKAQINKENLEKLFSYNVSNEKSLVIRAVPLFVKNIAMKTIYKTSARANTMTVTNLGLIKTADAYTDYIERFYAVLSMSKGQNIKGGVCSYKDTLVFTISSAVRETAIQKGFFKKLSSDGIGVSIETNGVYYE